MATVTISETNVYEREKEQVWAEEYAKRLTDALEAKHDNDVGEIYNHIDGLEDGTLIENGAIKNRHIANGQVDTDQLSMFAVTTAKLDNGAVTTAKLDNGAVTEDKIDYGAVTTDKIYHGAVKSDKIGGSEVKAFNLARDAVTSNKIKNLEVKTDKIDNFAVTANKLATDAVTTTKIKDGNVTLAKLAPDARVLYEYNTAEPVKIGTWTHDGKTKDIYRKAFQIDYDFLDDKDNIKFGDIGLEFSENDKVVVVDRKCILMTEYASDPNAGVEVPSYNESIVSGEEDCLFIISTLPSIVKTALQTDSGIFYGYIDYIYVPAN